MSPPDPSSSGGIRRLVRVELLGTVALVVLLLAAYAYFFVDDHLEWGLEYLGGRLVGAQVDVAELRTGWVRPALTVEGLAIADPEAPSTNWVELDVLSARLNLDALLRAKVVVEQARLEGVRLGTERARPGWVSEEEGDLRWVYDGLTRLLSAELHAAASGTVFEDLLSLVSGGSVEERWTALRDELATPGVLRRVNDTLGAKRTIVRETLEQLPDRATLRDLQGDLEDLRSDDGGGPAGQVDRLRRIQSLADRLERYSEQVGTVSSDLRSTLGTLSALRQDLESAPSDDLRMLRSRVSLPDPSVEDLSRRLVEGFLERRAGSLHDLLRRTRPYLRSPSSPSDGEPAAAERADGVDRRFGAVTGYPGFWLKRLDVSGAGDAGRGLAVEASLRHLSTDPSRVESPVEFSFAARPPSEAYSEIRGRVSLGNAGGSRMDYNLQIRGWPIRDWTLLSSSDAAVSIDQGTAQLGLEGTYTPGHLSTRLGLLVPRTRITVTSEDPRLEALLRETLGNLGSLDVRASGEGPPEDVTWSVQSNLGRAFERGLRERIRKGGEAVRAGLERRFRQEFGSRARSLIEDIDRLGSNARGTLEERRNLLGELKRSLSDLQDDHPALNLNLDLSSVR